MELSLIKHAGKTSKKGSNLEKQPLPSDAKSIAFAAPRLEVSKPLEIIDGGTSHISSDTFKPQDSETFVADAFPHPKAASLPAHTEASSPNKVKNIAYDDAYPDQNGHKKVDYDDVAEGLHEGGEDEKKPKLHDGGADDTAPLASLPQLDSVPEHQYVEENVNAPEVSNSEDTQITEEPYEEPTTRRRILYVTKRPRLGIVQN